MNMTEIDKWQTPLITSPYGVFTKKDIYEHYLRVRNKVFQELLGKPVLIRQSFSPEKIVLRRKDPQGNFIRLSPETYDYLAKKRLTEIHKVFGDKADEAVVDIDPGKAVPWEKVKEIAARVGRVMQETYGKTPQVQFSGGRGFYVKTKLNKPQDINKIREQLRKQLENITDDVAVLHPPKEHQVRLDLAPMKRLGSYRAPYSVNARTGLVATPISWQQLPKVERSDFVLKKQGQFFAPGIPAARRIEPIPPGQNLNWQLAIQEHQARRAGKHWDVRFVDPETGQAHSFAMRRTRLPDKKIQLAIQQPTHTAEYATTFSGTIPEGYGAGKVKLKTVSPITVVSASPDSLKFIYKGKAYALFRMEGDKWGFRRI